MVRGMGTRRNVIVAVLLIFLSCNDIMVTAGPLSRQISEGAPDGARVSHGDKHLSSSSLAAVTTAASSNDWDKDATVQPSGTEIHVDGSNADYGMDRRNPMLDLFHSLLGHEDNTELVLFAIDAIFGLSTGEYDLGDIISKILNLVLSAGSPHESPVNHEEKGEVSDLLNRDLIRETGAALVTACALLGSGFQGFSSWQREGQSLPHVPIDSGTIQRSSDGKSRNIGAPVEEVVSKALQTSSPTVERDVNEAAQALSQAAAVDKEVQAAMAELDRVLAKHVMRVVDSNGPRDLLDSHIQLASEAQAPAATIYTSALTAAANGNNGSGKRADVANAARSAESSIGVDWQTWASTLAELPKTASLVQDPEFLARLDAMNERLYPSQATADTISLPQGVASLLQVWSTSLSRDKNGGGSDAANGNSDDIKDQVDAVPIEEDEGEGQEVEQDSFTMGPAPVGPRAEFPGLAGAIMGIVYDRATDFYILDEDGVTCTYVGEGTDDYKSRAKYSTLFRGIDLSLMNKRLAQSVVCNGRWKNMYTYGLDTGLIGYLLYVTIAVIVSAMETMRFSQMAMPEGMGDVIDNMVDFEKDLHAEASNQDNTEHLIELEEGLAADTDDGTRTEVDKTADEKLGHFAESQLFKEGGIATIDLDAKRKFIRAMKLTLEENDGKLRFGDLVDGMHRILGWKKNVIEKLIGRISEGHTGWKGAMLGFNYINNDAISIKDFHEKIAQNYVSFTRQLRGNLVFIIPSFASFIAGFIMLANASNAVALGLAIAGFPILHIALYWVVRKFRSFTQSAKEQSAEDGNNLLLGLRKLASIFGVCSIFALLYHTLSRCLSPHISCPSGGKPTCQATGLPPRLYECVKDHADNYYIACDYSDVNYNYRVDKGDGPGGCWTTEAVCPHEEVPESRFDHGLFWIEQQNKMQKNPDISPISKSKFSKLTKEFYYIGMSTRSEECIADSNTFAMFDNPRRSYAYVVPSMVVGMKNIFHDVLSKSASAPESKSLPAGSLLTLKENDLHNITEVAMAPSDSGLNGCSDSTSRTTPRQLLARNDDDKGKKKESSDDFVLMGTTLSKLKEARFLEIYSPDDPQNYNLCFLRNGKWETLPYATVSVAPAAQCTDPDCSDADLSDGFGPSMADALYYSLITQSTIGYGDILALSRRARMLTGLQACMMMFIEFL